MVFEALLLKLGSHKVDRAAVLLVLLVEAKEYIGRPVVTAESGPRWQERGISTAVIVIAAFPEVPLGA